MEKENEAFLFNLLNGEVVTVPEWEIMFIAGGLNRLVGKDEESFEDIVGRHRIRILFPIVNWKQYSNFASRAYYNKHSIRKKIRENIIKYKTGGLQVQIDYMLLWKDIRSLSFVICYKFSFI